MTMFGEIEYSKEQIRMWKAKAEKYDKLKKPKTKKKMDKVLWIEVTETVTKNIGLEIGKDITEEKANELLHLTDDEDCFDRDSDTYDILDSYLGSQIETSEGFQRVNIYIQTEK